MSNNVKYLTAMALALCSLVTAARAQQVTVIGPGARATCGTWLDARSSDKDRELRLVFWAEGYLSGIAVWTQTNPLDQTNIEGISFWLDNYCRSHAANQFADALAA